MDLYERQDLQDFLVSLFGKQARGWYINEKIFNLTYELVAESSSCSSMMDFVPRPMPPGASAIKYLTKQAREMFIRSIKQSNKQYIVCLKYTAYQMVRKFQLASTGV